MASNAALLFNAGLRDGMRCKHCGGLARFNDPWEPDHVKPKSRYPELAEDGRNVVVSHMSCNRKKGAQSL